MAQVILTTTLAHNAYGLPPRHSSNSHLALSLSHHDSQGLFAEIIDVYPDSAGFTCVGWAPSKRRRCENPIKKENRRFATRLLDEGDRRIARSETVDDILEELAPRVLCNHEHQNQAFEMVVKWQERMYSFSGTRPSRQSSERSRLQYSRSFTRSQPERRQQRPPPASLPTPPPTPRRNHQNITQTSTTSVRRPLLQASAPSPLHTPSDVSAPSTDSPPADFFGRSSFPSRESQQHSARIRRASSTVSDSSPLPQFRPTSTQISEPSHPASAPRATRRPIAVGLECSICTEPLVPDRDHLEPNSLTWCMARCGTNFHRECIENWRVMLTRLELEYAVTETRPTCPHWYVLLAPTYLPFFELTVC
jgi:hypothetical protein